MLPARGLFTHKEGILSFQAKELKNAFPEIPRSDQAPRPVSHARARVRAQASVSMT
jgi:hypothetical protein